MKIKTILAIAVATIALLTISCSKDSESERDITQIHYEVGKTYIRKFYYNSHYIGIPYGGITCTSECGRLTLDIKSGNAAIPPAGLMNGVGGNYENDTKLKHYLIAEIKFTYTGHNDMGPFNTAYALAGEWRIVIGNLEEYIYKDWVYKKLVIQK